jgi:hypothetical protein
MMSSTIPAHVYIIIGRDFPAKLSLDHAVNWEAIGAIGQLVGAIAVVFSLIYLAREIRRNARLARQSSVDTLNGWLGQLAQHPHLAQLFDRGIRDLKSLEGADRVSFEALMLQWFHIFAEMYSQHLEGHLDPRVWREVETPMRDLIIALANRCAFPCTLTKSALAKIIAASI